MQLNEMNDYIIHIYVFEALSQGLKNKPSLFFKPCERASNEYEHITNQNTIYLK
jgi:hypothetical protein